MPGIELRDVSVVYDVTRVLDGVDLVVEDGSWTCLIGPNGAGKTTLLRAVAGLAPYEGVVALDGVDMRALRRRDAARRVAVVPQNPIIPLGMKVVDYVAMGRTPHISYLGMEGAADQRVVGEVIEQLELGDLAGRRLESLSGGELQRVILGKALAQQAPILVLDEPTSALDVGHQQQVLELVESLRVARGLTILGSMHDLTLAGQFADRLVLLAGGRVVGAGSAREVLTEAAIRRHYGAAVRVLSTADGVVVVPRRSSPGGLGRTADVD